MRGRLPGALRCHEMVCGAHERPPGRMWGLDSGFGIRSPDFVHPDARKLALECVSTADMGDACHRRASPPLPCVRRTSARPRRRFRGCGCVRRVGGGRSSSARDAWSSLRGDQGASRNSGAVAVPVKAVAPWRAVEGAEFYANLSGGIEEPAGCRGRQDAPPVPAELVERRRNGRGTHGARMRVGRGGGSRRAGRCAHVRPSGATTACR